MKIMAFISGFIFIGLAAMFGTAFSPIQTDLIRTGTSILFFVSIASFLLGVVFGPTAFRAVIVSGCLILLLMWLPMHLFYTDHFLDFSLAILLALFVSVGVFNKIGASLNPRLVGILNSFRT